ncbi:hypothetical protein M1L60_29895 [Actinoplanes sp. TRM 88003]|uniref:DUF4235 domain-containing protein n=1 Tax=Paractinoplanes aksuensis TaxID=2939490 RepID=A0ABT1DVD5_9ACTN|nr:hypothetical protein [Actinoplanes aksuensis]MCO8274817.1 hypothetical protein [Actinoplanes aksuensis]
MSAASFPRAAADAAYRAVLAGMWIAARDLSPARRRLARTGLIATGIGVEYAKSPSSFREMFDQKEPQPDEPQEFKPDKRQSATLAIGIGLAVTTMIARRRLEKRWMKQLEHSGHRHPAGALALRMVPVEFGIQLLLRAADRLKPTPDDESRALPSRDGT